MILQETDGYVKICMKAWLLCEASVHAEVASPSPRTSLIKECRECAAVCFELGGLLLRDAAKIENYVFNALLHCRQCAVECARYADDEDIRFCGDVCSVCGDPLHDITSFSLN
jgi:hypothetical protein